MRLAVTHWLDRALLLPRDKEVFDAETFAIYQALRVLDRRQESAVGTRSSPTTPPLSSG